MGSIGRYIFRTTFGAFAVVLVSVTILIWITQALRDIDLMTNQGQSVLVFIGITGLIIPLLVMLIAPIALMIATGYVLNKLSTDSELIVMNASGMPPWQIFRPFFLVGVVVSLNAPRYALPIGVRAVETITASLINIPLLDCGTGIGSAIFSHRVQAPLLLIYENKRTSNRVAESRGNIDSLPHSGKGESRVKKGAWLPLHPYR